MEELLNNFKNQPDHTTDKFKTKHAHYYAEAFSYLKNDVASLLEIGINRGGSIRAWRDFFVNATVYGIDIRSSCIRRCQGERISTHTIDVGQRDVLFSWAEGKEFDIVIDDGSHNNDHQIIAFEVLWPKVKPGGYYAIEDIAVAWNDKHINPEYPLLEEYLSRLIRPISTNKLDILSLLIRPNMVVIRKQRTNETTIGLI